MPNTRIAFTCPLCGNTHIGLPAFAYKKPAAFFGLSKEQMDTVKITDDICVIDDEQFYVRAVLEIPILGKKEHFEWGAWGSLSRENFQRYWDTYGDADQSKLGPMFSYLANALNGYPESLGLRCGLVPRDSGKRPLLNPHDDQDHPLVRDQINGITLDRALELLGPLLHKPEL